MSSSPARIVQNRLAALPDGRLAEAALDSSKVAWCRLFDGTAWSGWTAIASAAVDVSITAAPAGAAGVAYISVTPAAGGSERAVHVIDTTGSVSGASF